MRYLIIEVPPFTSHREQCFEGDEDYRKFQVHLMENPERWPVIPGAGPLRKARWGDETSARGKRGGCRVIYMQVPEARIIFLLHVYPKTRLDSIGKKDAIVLARLAKELRKSVLESRGADE